MDINLKKVLEISKTAIKVLNTAATLGIVPGGAFAAKAIDVIDKSIALIEAGVDATDRVFDELDALAAEINAVEAELASGNPAALEAAFARLETRAQSAVDRIAAEAARRGVG